MFSDFVTWYFMVLVTCWVIPQDPCLENVTSCNLLHDNISDITQMFTYIAHGTPHIWYMVLLTYGTWYFY